MSKKVRAGDLGSDLGLCNSDATDCQSCCLMFVSKVWMDGNSAWGHHRRSVSFDHLGSAVKQFFSKKWNEKFFELYDDGVRQPFKVAKR